MFQLSQLMTLNGLSNPVCFVHLLKSTWLDHICMIRNVNMQLNQNQIIGHPNIMNHSICKYMQYLLWLWKKDYYLNFYLQYNWQWGTIGLFRITYLCQRLLLCSWGSFSWCSSITIERYCGTSKISLVLLIGPNPY